VRLAFNRNAQAAFDEMEVLDTFEFTPNQVVVFVKTFNSSHSVRPMTGAGSPDADDQYRGGGVRPAV
jgi:hypothetical protein